MLKVLSVKIICVHLGTYLSINDIITLELVCKKMRVRCCPFFWKTFFYCSMAPNCLVNLKGNFKLTLKRIFQASNIDTMCYCRDLGCDTLLTQTENYNICQRCGVKAVIARVVPPHKIQHLGFGYSKYSHTFDEYCSDLEWSDVWIRMNYSPHLI